MTAVDKAGVLSKITDVFGRAGVSISSISQKEVTGGDVPVVIMTHVTEENAVRASIAEIENLDSVASVDSIIRVIE